MSAEVAGDWYEVAKMEREHSALKYRAQQLEKENQELRAEVERLRKELAARKTLRHEGEQLC